MKRKAVETKIREIPGEIYDLMKDRAKRNRRSLNQQIIVDLSSAADAEKALQDAAGEEYAAQQADDNRGEV